MSDYSAYLVSTAIASAISKALSLSDSLSPVMGVFVMQVMAKIDLEAHRFYIVLTALVGAAYYAFPGIREKCGAWVRPHTSDATLYDNAVALQLQTYMAQYPQYFDKHWNVSYGEQFEVTSTTVTSIHMTSGQRIAFNDLSFGVKGWIEIVKVERKSSSGTEDLTFMRPKIHMYKGDHTIVQYVDHIKRTNADDLAKSRKVELTYTKHISKDWSQSCTMYQAQQKPVELLESHYFGTFFHPEKEYLLNLMKKIHFDPEFFRQFGQTGTVNLILYGPPGTGKSTFVYRLALLLGRDVKSVDLSNFSKEGAYKVIMKTEATKNIILLEEFDNTVASIENTMSPLIPFTLGDTAVKSTREEFKYQANTRLTVGDLLEILQGSVPVEGRIIIATTNHLEEMRTKYPALFRPGRLTPIHFDYLKADQINLLSKCYFGESIGIDYDPNMATSHIIDLAMRAKMKGGMDWFRKELLRSSTSSE